MLDAKNVDFPYIYFFVRNKLSVSHRDEYTRHLDFANYEILVDSYTRCMCI